MIDLGPRLYDHLGTGKRKHSYDDIDISNGIAVVGGECKRRKTSPGTRLLDLQIVSEESALQEIQEICDIGTVAPATRLEIVVVDENWEGAISSPEATIINLDDLGPLNGTSSLHEEILRESQQSSNSSRTVSPASTHYSEPVDNDIGSLDWLINFKVDSVFESRKGSSRTSSFSGVQDKTVESNTQTTSTCSCGVSSSVSGGAGGGVSEAIPAKSKSSSSPVAVQGGASTPATSTTSSSHQSSRYSGPGKPPFTYTELIELALKDKGKLTVKEIYQWITKHFPFYKAVDERWKNSVRHNLSINPHFRKESKAPQGAGHLWVVVDNSGKAKNTWKEERIQNFLASQVTAAEVAAATASITDDDSQSLSRDNSTPSPGRNSIKSQSMASTPISTSVTSSGQRLDRDQLNTWWPDRNSLERSAEEILSGVKREVAVEFLTPVDLDTDDSKLEVKEDKGFLYDDLTAEQVIAESGLQDELAGLYLLNDMTAGIGQDSFFADDLNFGGLELPLSG